MSKTNYSRLICYFVFYYMLYTAKGNRTESNEVNSIESPETSSFCRKKCWNGDNCADEKCWGCFFTCPSKSCRIRQGKCAFWCDTEDDCSKSFCEGCKFCPQPNITIPNEAISCPIATFQDETSTLFSTNSNYWKQWNHSGMPYPHEGAPLFVDINGDNVLDYFNSMHGHPMNKFSNRMELGLSLPRRSSTESYTYTLHEISERIINTDANNETIDAHGEVIADLDGDGFLDILISNGGGRGEPSIISADDTDDTNINQDYGNWLFWGEAATDDLTNEPITVFKGGRDAARLAGVDMKMGRGRFNYLLDVDANGLLDIFHSQDRRIDNLITPGILLINQGDRTWKKDESMKEYARTMMITDADGDGFAREFLINRGFCYPKRDGPGIDRKQPELGPFSQHVKAFCSTRPVGTNAVYRFDNKIKGMKEISAHYQNFWAASTRTRPCCNHDSYNGNNDCNAHSMASGDFDGDIIADQVLLYSSKLVFFFSSDRQKGELPDNAQHIGHTIKLPKYCSSGLTLRIVDFDNDGKEEILVGCQNAATFLLYKQGSSKRDWTLDKQCNGIGSLGDLSVRSLATPTKDDMSVFCGSFNTTEWGMAGRVCKEYESKSRMTFTKLAGIAVADINNDGFQDIVTTHEFGYLRFFINKPTAQSEQNKFISFKLIGDVNANRPNNYHGIGATVILRSFDTSNNGDVVSQFREVSSFQHTTDRFGSKEDRIIFGLGQNLRPHTVIIKWSNRKIQELNIDDWEFTRSLEPIEIMDRGSKLKCCLSSLFKIS
jgi:hypothetical protein